MDSGILVQSISGGTTNTILSNKHPLLKMDRINPVSFQTFNLTFNSNVPYSSGTGTTTTIYKFPHGYKYAPLVWMLGEVVISGESTNPPTFFVSASTLSEVSLSNYITLGLVTDDENVYVNTTAYYNDLASAPPSVKDMSINIRVYVFVQNIAMI